MKAARPSVFPLVAATIALVAVLATHALSVTRALAIWIIVLAAVVLAGLVRSVREGDGPHRTRRFEAALRRRPAESSTPVELVRMDRELELGITNASYAHRRLLPLLRTAAAARLGTRHGLDFERRPGAARALLGDDVWELLRPDRPGPADRHGPGVPRKRIVAAIERVESL